MTSILYTVQPGNTLWGIAQYFGTTVEDILRYNNIQNPDMIYPGQQIRVPVGMGNIPKWYVVRPSDTLFSIAQRYGLDVNDLIDNNNLANPNVIYPGQLIMLRNM